MSSSRDTTESGAKKRKHIEIVDLTADEEIIQGSSSSSVDNKCKDQPLIKAKLISKTDTSVEFEVYGEPEVWLLWQLFLSTTSALIKHFPLVVAQ